MIAMQLERQLLGLQLAQAVESAKVEIQK